MLYVETFWEVFGDVLIAIWFGLTLIAALIGLWALLSPTSFMKFNQRLSVWVKLEKGEHSQQKPIVIERPFYRYHIFTGLILIVAALFVLYEVIFNLDVTRIEESLMTDSAVQNTWIGILVDASFGWIYISGFVALIIGSIVVIRPSYLKGIENKLNYWVETEKYGHSLDKNNQILDEWVTVHPRIFGIISLLGSAIVAWSLYQFGYLT